MRPSRAATALVVSALAALAAVPSAASSQEGPEIRAVDFRGNETFSSDSLSRAIRTTETECRSWIFWIPIPIPLCVFDFSFTVRRAYLSQEELPRDVARLEIWYQRRGFREAQVGVATTEQESGDVEVLFDITEGRPVLADSVAYVGAEGVAVPGLMEDLPLRQGDRWSTLALDATRDTLVRRMRNRGYPYADVLRQTFFPAGEPYRARVTFEVEPGVRAQYGDIQVVGNTHLSDSTVLKTLPFRSGDPFRADQLIDGQGRLFGLEMVTSATITPDLSSPDDSIVPLVVQVAEGDLYRFRAGAGGNTAECANVEARLTSRNFMGGGRVLQVRGRLSNLLTPQFRELLCPQGGEGPYGELTWFGSVTFSQPWIFSTRNSFNASVFVERQSVPEIFIREAFGLELAIVRAVGPRTPLTLSYRPEISRLDAAEILLCTGLLVCTQEDVDFLTSAQRLAPIGINLARDLSNSLLNPASGYRLVFDFEHAAEWTLSDYNYNRTYVEASRYTRLNPTSVLATRVRGGWLGSRRDDIVNLVIPPHKRFYAGGANSVRGFGQNQLGPSVLFVPNPGALMAPIGDGGAGCTLDEVVALTCDATAYGGMQLRAIGGTQMLEGNVELRFALTRDFEAVTFADAGQVWAPGQGVDLSELEVTPGFGFRYLSPIGPIRLDLGYNFRSSASLPVLTERIEPSAEPPGWMGTGDLAVLGPRVEFTETGSRFQLHISIGQAF